MKIIYKVGEYCHSSDNFDCREELLIELRELPEFVSTWHIINFSTIPLEDPQIKWANHLIISIVNGVVTATGSDAGLHRLGNTRPMFYTCLPHSLQRLCTNAEIPFYKNRGGIINIPAIICQIPVISAITFAANFIYHNNAKTLQNLMRLYNCLQTSYRIQVKDYYVRLLNTSGRALAHSQNGSTGLWCLLLFCQAVFDGHLSSEVFKELLVKYDNIDGMNSWHYNIMENGDDAVLKEHYHNLYAPSGIRKLFRPYKGLY